MSFAFFHQGTSEKDVARRKRNAATREYWRECDVCGELVGVSAFAKESPNVCKYCRGECKHKSKARRRRANL